MNFLFAGLTIRYLGNEQAGFFIVLSSIFGLSQAAAGLGLTNPATKRAAELFVRGEYCKIRQISGSLLLVNCVLGAFIFLICIILFPSIFRWSRLAVSAEHEAYHATLYLGAAFLAEQAGGALRVLYAAGQRQDLRNYTLAAVGLGGGLAKIVWLALIPTMPAAAAANLAVSVAWLAIDFWLVRGLVGGFILPTWCTAEVRPLLRFSGWELVSSIGICAGGTIDRFILTTYLGTGSLTYYAIAQRFFQLIHTALAQQFSFVFPLLAATTDDASTRIAAVQDRLRWLLASLGAALYAGVFLVGPTAIAYLVGVEFAEKARWAIYLVAIQGLAVAFVLANYFLHYVIGNGSANALFNFGTNVGVTLLALVLIPRFDYIGASLAQLAVVIGAAALLIGSKHVLNVPGTLAQYATAYVSPLMLFVITCAIGKSVDLALGGGLGAVVLGVAVGYAFGTGALVLCEITVFASFNRLDSVKCVWAILRGGSPARPCR